jgi:Alkyl sulfatase C-terminal
MATIDECTTALQGVLGPIASSKAAEGLDRSLSCRLTDLDQVLLGRLTAGAVRELHAVPDGPSVPKADIRLTMTSDDLLALTSGELSFGKAWSSGRLRLEAGIRDILRLRSVI